MATNPTEPTPSASHVSESPLPTSQLAEQKTKLLDVLDTVELRLMKFDQISAAWSALHRNKEAVENIESIDDLIQTATKVGFFVETAPVGLSMSELEEMVRQRNIALSVIGDASFSSLKAAAKEFGYSLVDLLDEMQGDTSALNETDRVHEQHVLMGEFIHAINDQLYEGEKIEFDKDFDCFSPDNLTITHEGDNRERVSTVSYGESGDNRSVTFNVPNPVSFGEPAFRNVDLINVAKEAFYGHSQLYQGAITSFSLATAAKSGTDIVQSLLNDPMVKRNPELEIRLSSLNASLRATFADILDARAGEPPSSSDQSPAYP